MFIGPVFHREATISPRRRGVYIARTAYAGILLLLMSTAFLILTGTQYVADVGDLARFGMVLFQILAPLQLTLVIFSSALLAANAVAQEKDRRTLDLLLMTNLSNSELVLGKLMASLLNMLVLLAAAVPLFMLATLFGGVSFGQIGRVFAVTAVAALACGSLGSILALWREKTFQALAMTVLVLVLWLAVWEIVAAGAVGAGWLGISARTWAVGFSPWQAILEATRPYPEVDPALGPVHTPANLFLMIGGGLVVLLNGLAVARVRVWNPSREARQFTREDETWRRQSIWGAEYDLARETPSPAASGSPQEKAATSRHGRTREVWDNPVIWREMRTWAYGRRILMIRLIYLLLFALAAASLWWLDQSGHLTRETGSLTLVPLFLLSLILVNVQAVTSLTSERDGKALDLLLVSDLSAKEIVFGKLGGVFYNTKEMVALPIVLCVYVWYTGLLGLENLVYLVGGLLVLYAFVAMLGIHIGMSYPNSRSAIATSLGTVFFLFLGVAVCMRMMVAFSGSFQAQLQPFLAFMIGGGVGLYVALGARNPSPAIGVASFLCPFATFYAITSFFLDYTLGVFLVAAVAYGFTTAAMLVPAIYEFDVATGRTTIGEQ